MLRLLQAIGVHDEVEEIIYHRCRRLLRQQELIRGLISYRWLPPAKAA